MILAAERHVEALCEDFLSGEASALWENAEIYILDFYEDEDSADIWRIRTDGSAATTPVQFIENEHGFEPHGLKGYFIADFSLTSQIRSDKWPVALDDGPTLRALNGVRSTPPHNHAIP